MFSQSENGKTVCFFLSNVAYTYNSKYTLNGSIRVDQSNLYGSDPSVQFKPIWSVGVAWNLKRESFMDQVDFLNRLVSGLVMVWEEIPLNRVKEALIIC